MRDVHNILFQADGAELPKTASDIGKPIAQDVPIGAEVGNNVERLARELATNDGKDPDALSHNSFAWWRHYAPEARSILGDLA